MAVTGAEMQEQAPEHGSGSASGSLFALYTIHVDVGGQELESKRRYSEFRALDRAPRPPSIHGTGSC